MSQPTHITIVSHTHWDRAWYVTFQEFRARLVRLVDRLLRLLAENPDYRVFMLDGQMAVLEDYLEVRPQRQAELERLCLEGRLKVGPWYVLADEFLVSPEALIRNMQLGFRMGATYGGVSKIGYVPDGFGHVAQLPQILRGFGIDNAFFWRGLGAEGERLGTEFVWKAPDGSDVTTIWMPFGYHNISNLGYPIHWGDTSQMEFDPDLALSQIQRAIDTLMPMCNTDSLLLMNGIDHEEAEPRLPAMVELANARLRVADHPYQFTHGTLEEHLCNVRNSISDSFDEHAIGRPILGSPLPEFCGEFRWGKYSEILQGVYATRIYLKQRNYQVETLLERYAEPLAALAWLGGAEIPEGTQDLLWTAWRWLLKNHPHDDIYGSGIDAVHDEMEHRFSQAEQIGKVIVRDSLRQLALQVDFSAQPGMPVMVFNPLSWPRQEIAVGEVDFEFDDPLAQDFQLVDREGNAVPCQVLGVENVFWMETLKANRKRRVRIAFPAVIPACGYSTYYIQEARPSTDGRTGPSQGSSGDWKIQPDGAENRFLSFQIAFDGGLTLFDKISGVVYSGMGHFEDVEDAGDEYTYCPCPESQSISTRGQTASIRQLTSGPNLVTFEITHSLPISEGLTEDRQRRSEQVIHLPIRCKVTLYRDQPGLFIETELTNQARDHKLSVVFPSNLNPAQAFVDACFAVMQREVDLPDSTGWVEDPTPLMHQRAFTDLSDQGVGLAVFNRGLPAVEVKRQDGGTAISLTLLRCVGWLSRDDLSVRRVAAGPLVPTPGAQCLGTYRFEYAIYPHPGAWRKAFQAAYQYVTPTLVSRADTHEGLELKEMNITRDDPTKVRVVSWQRSGPNPDRSSFVSCQDPLALSSLHRNRDGSGLIARFYNPGAEPVNTAITIGWSIAEAWRVNLNEERLEPFTLQDGHSLALQVGGYQILTLELRPKLS